MNLEIKFRAFHKETKTMSYNITLPMLNREKELILANPVEEYEWLLFFGKKDKKGVDIYAGDVIELVNCDNITIKVLCEYGTVQRRLVGGGDVKGTLCDITGFYFRTENDNVTFPIFENYLGKHDVELFEVIGNIYENPELFKIRG